MQRQSCNANGGQNPVPRISPDRINRMEFAAASLQAGQDFHLSNIRPIARQRHPGLPQASFRHAPFACLPLFL
jgi:hypothetical protein